MTRLLLWLSIAMALYATFVWPFVTIRVVQRLRGDG
jgi:hypothetical protein